MPGCNGSSTQPNTERTQFIRLLHTEVLEWCVAMAKWAAQTQRVNITKIATTTAQSGSLMSSLHDFQSQIFFIFIFILIIHMVDTISSTMPGNLSAIEAM